MIFKWVLIVFLPFFSWGDLQYRPDGSAENHEITLGLFKYSFDVKDWKELGKEGYFVDYSFYLSSIHRLFENKYKHFGRIGFTGGARVLEGAFQNEGSFFHLGIRARVSYLENILPLFEYGGRVAHWSRWGEGSEKSQAMKSFISSSLSHYVSLGLNFSLKLFDRKAIYNLDEDYGINDVGIQTKCTLLLGEDISSSDNSIS